MATKVQKSLRDRAIELEGQIEALNRELVPVLRELRQRFNELVDDFNGILPIPDPGYTTIQDEGVNLPQWFNLNFVGGGIAATDDAGNSRTNVTVALGAGVAFGTVGQIPYMNAGGTNFSYSSGFTFDGTGLKLTAANGFLQISDAANVASQGDIRADTEFDFFAYYTGGLGPAGDVAVIRWDNGLSRLTIGGDVAGVEIPQIVISASVDVVIQNSAGGQGIQLGSGGTSIGYFVGGGGFHTFTGGIVFTDTAFAGAGTVSSTGLIRAANNTTALAARNAANSGDLPLVATSGSDVVTYGNGSGNTVINCSSTLALQRGGTAKLSILSASVAEFGTATIRWVSTVASPTVTVDPTAGAAGQSVIYTAQPTSNTGGTAGNATLQGAAATASSGTHTAGNAVVKAGLATAGGTPVNGKAQMQNAAGTVVVEVDDTGLGVFGAAPVAQPADLGAPAFADPAAQAWCAALRTNVLRALGLTA